MNSTDFGVELDQKRTHEGNVAPNPNLLLTIPEAAARLRISRSSIYRLFEAGELRRMSRVPWNFGGGPVSIRLRSPRHCARRVRQVR